MEFDCIIVDSGSAGSVLTHPPFALAPGWRSNDMLLSVNGRVP